MEGNGNNGEDGKSDAIATGVCFTMETPNYWFDINVFMAVC